MNKLLILYLITFLLIGCTQSDNEATHVAEPSISMSGPDQWLSLCKSKWSSVHKREEGVIWFNGIGANDVIYLPKEDANKEIFQKCLQVIPLSDYQTTMYKAWLTKCISEIQTIVPGTPRIRVNQLLYLDGGVFSPSAATYLHSDCGVLKVRIQFETDPSNNNLDYFGSKNDKVIAISIPYLGWPAYD